MDVKKMETLTPKQREAVELREQGMTLKQVAEQMGVSYNAAREHLHRAERRFREYDQYMAAEQRNQEPVELTLSRGEVKLVLDALRVLENKYEKEVVRSIKTDWRAKLPYESKVIADLYDRLQIIVYGKPMTRLPSNWEKDE